jgi:hypothetical protein
MQRRGAPPQKPAVGKRIYSKDFCAIEKRWRRGLLPENQPADTSNFIGGIRASCMSRGYTTCGRRSSGCVRSPENRWLRPHGRRGRPTSRSSRKSVRPCAEACRKRRRIVVGPPLDQKRDQTRRVRRPQHECRPPRDCNLAEMPDRLRTT